MEYGKLVLNPSPEEIPQDFAPLRDVGLDTETYGLHWDHRAFSFQISDGNYTLYWNLKPYPDAPFVGVVSEEFTRAGILKALENVDEVYIANAKFDMRRLDMIGADPLKYRILCNHSMFRLIESDAPTVSLDSQGEFYGIPKDDAVKAYIKAEKLYTTQDTFGYTTGRDMHYDKVPWNLIQPYACRDAYLSLMIGRKEKERLKDNPLLEQEIKLTKALYRMEKRGILVDKEHVISRIKFHAEIMEKAKLSLGFDFKDHSNWYQKKFKEHGLPITLHWKKKTPTFTTKVLEKHKGLEFIDSALIYRLHHNMLFNFYFKIYNNIDKTGRIHADMVQYAAATGRMSAKNPTLSNLPARTPIGKEVKKCFIPDPQTVFYNPDYQAAELRITYDRSNEIPMIRRIFKGEDMHSSLASMARTSRNDAKTVFFAKIYGSGIKGIAEQLGRSYTEAKDIVVKIDKSIPKVQAFKRKLESIAKTHGMLRNPFGRILKIDKDFIYKCLNYYIQSTLADVIKLAIVRIDEYLEINNCKSFMTLSVHDSLLFVLHRSELHLQKEISRIMSECYNDVNGLRLTVTSEHSEVNYGDTKEGEYYENERAG